MDVKQEIARIEEWSLAHHLGEQFENWSTSCVVCQNKIKLKCNLINTIDFPLSPKSTYTDIFSVTKFNSEQSASRIYVD